MTTPSPTSASKKVRFERTSAFWKLVEVGRDKVRESDAMLLEHQAKTERLPTLFLDLGDQIKTVVLDIAKRLDDVDDAGNRMYTDYEEIETVREIVDELKLVYPLVDYEAGRLQPGSKPGTFWGAVNKLLASPDKTTDRPMLGFARWFVHAHRHELSSVADDYENEDHDAWRIQYGSGKDYAEAYKAVERMIWWFQ